MKLSYALQAACIALSLSSASAATSAVAVNDATEKAKPGTTVDLQISFTTGAAHAAAGDYFEITLPDSFDATLAATPVTAEVTLNCVVSGTAEDLTLATHYDATYANRKLKFAHKATKLCEAGAVKVTLKKATMRASKVTKETVLVANSKETGEVAAPVKGPAADVALVANALPGTPPTASDIAFDTTAKTFGIKYNAGTTDVSAGKLMVVLYDYTAGASAKCKIGTTDVSTLSKGQIGKYTWLELTLSATDKLVKDVKNDISCSEITPNTGRAAYAGGVQLWLSDDKAVFLSTPAVVVPTPAPASNKTNGTTTTTGTGVSACVATYGTESAAAGTDVTKLCAAIKKYGTCIDSHKSDALYTATKTAIDELNKKCAEHSSSSKAVASTFVIAAAAFAAAY